jgi:hypothetical protein
MEGELPLAPDRDEAGGDEPIEVVVQGRPRDVEPLLQFGRRNPLRTDLDYGSQERETRDVAESRKLFGMALDLAHVYVSSNIDIRVNDFGPGATRAARLA